MFEHPFDKLMLISRKWTGFWLRHALNDIIFRSAAKPHHQSSKWSRQVDFESTERTNWSATPEARRRGLPLRALAGGENHEGCGISPTRLGIRRCADRACAR